MNAILDAEIELYRNLVQELTRNARDIQEAVAKLHSLPLPSESSAFLAEIEDSVQTISSIVFCDLPHYEPAEAI